MILTALTLQQFNDLPSYRWVSLPCAIEVKIGGSTVGVKIGAECSYKTFKNGKEAHAIFESFVSRLRRSV